MLALAAMCRKKKWKFIYYTKKLSATQKNEHEGNYAHALKLGMQHVEIENDYYKEFIASLRLHVREVQYKRQKKGSKFWRKRYVNKIQLYM